MSGRSDPREAHRPETLSDPSTSLGAEQGSLFRDHQPATGMRTASPNSTHNLLDRTYFPSDDRGPLTASAGPLVPGAGGRLGADADRRRTERNQNQNHTGTGRDEDGRRSGDGKAALAAAERPGGGGGGGGPGVLPPMNLAYVSAAEQAFGLAPAPPLPPREEGPRAASEEVRAEMLRLTPRSPFFCSFRPNKLTHTHSPIYPILSTNRGSRC